MKIKKNYLARLTIEEFADQHFLTMVVQERSKKHGLPRFYASFENSEIKGDGILIGMCGNGETEEAAIKDYGERISGETLVLDAYTDSRREIQVPVLIVLEKKEEADDDRRS